MLDLTTILSLYLPSEVNENNHSMKFVNGDKPWQDVSLGKNPKAADAAFFAVQQASVEIPEQLAHTDIR